MSNLRLALFLTAVITLGRANSVGAAEPERVVRLSIHPVAATQPSLRYKLLPDLIEQSPGNAATLYLIAMKLGPDPKEARELLDKATEYLELSADQLPRDQVEHVLAPFEYRLRQADLAAHRQDANWDWAFREQGASALLPYLGDMRGLAILWALEARLRIAQKDWPAAQRAIQDALSLARHLNRQAAMVQGLVETGIAAEMLERAVRDWVCQPGSPNLYWALSGLPNPFIDVHEVGKWERATVYFTFPVLLDAQSGKANAEQWRQFLVQLPALSGDGTRKEKASVATEAQAAILAALNYPPAREHWLSTGRTLREIEAMPVDEVVGTYFSDQYRQLADRTWEAWELPFWQGVDDLRRRREGEQLIGEDRGNPLVAFARPVARARFQFARLDRHIAMMRITEAIRDYAARHNGRPPASLAEIEGLPVPIDPVLGKPFRYEQKGQTGALEGASYDPYPADGDRYELTVVR